MTRCKRTNRRQYFGCLTLLLCLLFTLPLQAEESDAAFGETLPDEYGGFLDSLPDGLLEVLPNGIESEKAEEMGNAVSQMSDFSYLLQTVLSLVGVRLGDCLQLLASVSGLLLLSAVFKALSGSFRQESVGRAFSFCSTLIITLVLLAKGYTGIEAVATYLDGLRNTTAASIPLLGALYAMGGNVSAAAASSAGLTVFLSVLESVISRTVIPFCGICLAFSVMNAMDPALRLGTLLATLKKNYTTLLTFLMMFLLAMLGAQTTLSARSDTLAMKSVKFAAGNMIPVVGGSVSELLRTVSACVGYLRGGVGICGILVLVLLLLPTLIELLLLRLTWQIAASLADLLGCDHEKRLLEEFASLGGYLIAAVAICSAVPLLSFTLLLRCASAIG